MSEVATVALILGLGGALLVAVLAAVPAMVRGLVAARPSHEAPAPEATHEQFWFHYQPAITAAVSATLFLTQVDTSALTSRAIATATTSLVIAKYVL